MKTTALTCLLASLLLQPAFAQDLALESVNRVAFDSIDLNNDDQLSFREVDLFRQDVMVSQDYDDDGMVTRAEYMEWAMGWKDIAQERGLTEAYWKAREDVFDQWDLNDDGVLDPTEQDMSQSADFYVAADQTSKPLSYTTFKTKLRIIAEMNKAVSNPTEVTLINVFEVPEGALDAAITAWTKSRDFLQTQPGYISTALHQSIQKDSKFALINVAIWESAEAFQKANAKMQALGGTPQIEGLRFTPGLYTVIARD